MRDPPKVSQYHTVHTHKHLYSFGLSWSKNELRESGISGAIPNSLIYYFSKTIVMKAVAYIMLLLGKNVFTKCLLFKSSSGSFYVEKKGLSFSCGNGTALKSSSNDKIYCLTKNQKIAENETLTCVNSVPDKMGMRGQDFMSQLQGQDCKCGIENGKSGSSNNRIMYPTNVKNNTYPWVVQMFRYRKYFTYQMKNVYKLRLDLQSIRSSPALENGFVVVIRLNIFGY